VVRPAANTPIDPRRRAQLLHVKLRALVRDHLGREVREAPAAEPVVFGRGAALVDEQTAWVLLDEAPERSLGAALAWSLRRSGVEEVAIVTEASSGVLARRAALFDTPIAVWHAVDRVLVPAVPEPYPDRAAVEPAHEEFRAMIAEAGADPIDEHGVLVGEVRGLEVCRVVTDATTGVVRLEVGVGIHDREAFLMLHGARPTTSALREVVEVVQRHRTLGTDPHPLNRLGAERFLRWSSIAEPHRLGLRHLRAAAPPVPRRNVKDPVPCVAIGEAGDGSSVIAVYSTGIDLDLVPFAVDARAFHDPTAALLLVVPERDASPVTRSLAAAAPGSIDLVPW